MSDVQMVRFDASGHKIIGTIYDLWRRLDYTKSVLKKSSHDINGTNPLVTKNPLYNGTLPTIPPWGIR